MSWWNRNIPSIFGPEPKAPQEPCPDLSLTERGLALGGKILSSSTSASYTASVIREIRDFVAQGGDLNNIFTFGRQWVPRYESCDTSDKASIIVWTGNYAIAEELLKSGPLISCPFACKLPEITKLMQTLKEDTTSINLCHHNVVGDRKDLQILLYTTLRIEALTSPWAYKDELPPEVQKDVDRLQRYAAPSIARTRIYKSEQQVDSLSFMRKIYNETGDTVLQALPPVKDLTFENMPEMAEAVAQAETEEAEIKELGIKIYGTTEDIREAFAAARDILLATRQAYMAEIMPEDTKTQVTKRLENPQTIAAVSRLYVEDTASGKPRPEFPFFRYTFNRASKTKTTEVIAGLETAMTDTEHKLAAFDTALGPVKMRVPAEERKAEEPEPVSERNVMRMKA